jgi:hypothetical protein
MPKKKRLNNSIQASNEFTTLEVDSNLKPVEEEKLDPSNGEDVGDTELEELLGEKTKSEIIEKANSSKFLSRLTPEMAEKLEKIDSLEKHCLELEK